MLAALSVPQLGRAAGKPAPRPAHYPPAVISFQLISAATAAGILRGIYPSAHIHVEPSANAVVVDAPAEEVSGMRVIATGIDVKNPTASTIDTVQLHTVSVRDTIGKLRSLFPRARLTAAPNRTVILAATPADIAAIKTVIGAMDTAPATPTPGPPYATEAVRVTQRNARDIARAAAMGARHVRLSVAGSEIVVSGPPDEMTAVKALITQLDVPQSGSSYTAVYRLRYVDATSVGDLLRRSFPGIAIEVDKGLNAVTVEARPSIQQRIADAVGQLDVAPSGAATAAGAGSAGGGGGQVEVLTLKAAIPGQNGAPSTTATDLATTVQSALASNAPDLKITVPANSTQLVLTGSQYSIGLAKDLIAKLDVALPIVVLDTEVLEVDEGVAKQLGLKFPTAALTTTFGEIPPAPNSLGLTPPFLGIQPLTRTPLSLTAELDFLVATNKARILEDPRLTTISGHTASLRAGETLNILTTTGGGTGTVATTQVQSFQTGVTLDITPVVNDGGYITISLHPSVNTEAGSSAGVPNIQTRDVTTSVGLHDGETVVIGGLIEEDRTRSTQKVPLLGDLPLIGGLFRDTSVQYTRNELIVTVTPHILRPGDNGQITPSSAIPRPPQPEPLPTLAPGTALPPPSPHRARTPVTTPAPAPAPIDVPAPRVPVTPAPSPAAARPSSAPQPLPTAFTQTNTYTYGSAPQNNYADPQAPPQIFYAQVQPTVVKSGQSMTISAITTTNVTRLTFGPTAMLPQVSLAMIGPGKWQSTFNFSTSGLAASQGNVQLTLNAYTSLGATVTVPIPLSLVNQ